MHQQTPKQAEMKPESSRCEQTAEQTGTGWLVGIGLAVIACAMLYNRRLVASVPVPGPVPKEQQELHEAQPRGFPKHAHSRPLFDINVKNLSV